MVEQLIKQHISTMSNIEINPKNKGKFTATKKRSGKSTEELTHSKNPLTRKRAIFAQNAKKWSHKENEGIERLDSNMLMQLVTEELTRSDVDSAISRKLSSSYDSSDFKSAVRKVAADVIEDLYKTLWNRSSTWKNGVTR